MSTGLDCGFVQHESGEWHYELETWCPHGEHGSGEYDVYGPFPTFEAAQEHLRANHANPGGYWVDAQPQKGTAT